MLNSFCSSILLQLESLNFQDGETFVSKLPTFKTLFVFVFLTLFKLPDPGASIYVQCLLKFPTWRAKDVQSPRLIPWSPPSGITLIAALLQKQSTQNPQNRSNSLCRVTETTIHNNWRRFTFILSFNLDIPQYKFTNKQPDSLLVGPLCIDNSENYENYSNQFVQSAGKHVHVFMSKSQLVLVLLLNGWESGRDF